MVEEFTREMIAYAIMGMILLIAIPSIAIGMRNQRRQKLRRRGIKRYGH